MKSVKSIIVIVLSVGILIYLFKGDIGKTVTQTVDTAKKGAEKVGEVVNTGAAVTGNTVTLGVSNGLSVIGGAVASGFNTILGQNTPSAVDALKQNIKIAHGGGGGSF